MICRLCLQDKKLIKAHVISKFMFKDIFIGVKLLEVNIDNLSEKKVVQDTAYDYDILCQECESLINKYETYAARVVYNEKNRDFYEVDDGEVKSLILKGVDYGKFKLFLLSNLWRASISKLYLFRNVSLGRSHEEKLRRMIIEADPGEVDDYPCWIFKMDESVNRNTKTIATPTKIKQQLNTSYVFLVNEYFYWYNISPYNIHDFILRTTIDKNNEMAICILRNRAAYHFADVLMHVKLSKLRKR